MRDFVDTLPLRLAAVVAAFVGVICLWKGIDLWVSAWRIGVTFVVLLLAGLVVRRLILSLGSEATHPRGDAYPQARATKDDAAPSSAAPASGKNVDVIAPGTPIGDLLRDDTAEDK